MTGFITLSALARAAFALWALLLCLTCLASAVLAVVRRRSLYIAPALLLFAPTYLLWQVLFDLRLFGVSEKAAALSGFFGAVPWLTWLASFVLFTLAAALLLGSNLRYGRAFLTPGAVKLFLDQVSCGVCCWRDNGRVLLSNICMNRLCAALTGGRLLNGNQFRDAVMGGILTVDGRVWRFSCRDFVSEGELLHEMIASDITTEYAKTQALERDQAELSQLNQRLAAYYQSIDDTVRKQEILQAKVSIHDEMNRLMLSTTAAKPEDAGELDRIFSLWEQNALLLCREANETADAKASDRLDRLASAIGIRLIWQDAIPVTLTEEQRSLLYFAAQEAAVNAVKHAEAKKMQVSFSETEAEVFCRLTNDGRVPSGAVRFTGGLLNLSLLAGKQGASVSAETDGAFTLALRFPKKPPIG